MQNTEFKQLVYMAKNKDKDAFAELIRRNTSQKK